MSNYTLSPNPAAGKNFVVFTDAPYLLSTLALSITATSKSTSSVVLGVSTPLVLGVDYFPVLAFNQATGELGVPVYGGVQFADTELAGTLNATFVSLGNAYAASPTNISAMYADDEFEPAAVWWEHVVTGLPIYPHTTLSYSSENQRSIDDVIALVNQIAAQENAAIAQKSVFDFTAHTGDLDNPHNTSAEQLGVGHVPNWDTGTAATIIAGGSQEEFVTPLSIKDSVNVVVPRATQTIIGKTELNQGDSPGDATNSTDGLTAAGLLYLLDHGLIESGAGLANNQRQAVQFTPFPIVYPASWHGHICTNFEALVHAVQQETGIAKLTAKARTGTVYFPHTATAPDLTLD